MIKLKKLLLLSVCVICFQESSCTRLLAKQPSDRGDPSQPPKEDLDIVKSMFISPPSYHRIYKGKIT